MDLHQLYVFTKVVEHKSFSKAADDIFLSQSTVSSHIQALENMLNENLFDRVGRESVLTPSGERLYHWASKLLLLKDEALLDLNNNKKDLKGVIRVGASSVPGQFILPDMIKEFRVDYPQVTFHITESPSKDIADKVLHGTVDIGIIGEKMENERLQYTPLMKEKLVVITSSKMKLEGAVTIEEIIKYPMIMRNANSGTNTFIKTYLKSKCVPKTDLNVVAYTDSGQSLIQLVKKDIGIGIISEIAAMEYFTNKDFKIYPIDDFMEERYFYLVYNKNKTLSMVSKLFINTYNSLKH